MHVLASVWRSNVCRGSLRSECNILASSILECGLRPVFYDLFVDTWHDLETVRPSLLPFQEERTVDQRRKQLGWTELSWGTKILTCNSLVSKENTDGSLVPVPVRILNIVTQTGGRPNLNLADTEANDDVLVRRFMLCDGISGRESGPGGPGEAYLDGTGYLRVLRWAAHLAVQAGPNSLLLGVLNALKNGHLGAGWSGRVPGRLVSHFLLFVSQFFSFVSQARCLWSGSRLACLPLPFICLPLLFICLPVLFPLPVICLPLLFICLPGWVLVVRFPAGLSPTSFHLSRTSFHLSGWVLWSGLRLACLPRAFICLPLLSFVSQFFSFVSQFFSFLVSQAGCLWSGSRLACLALPFICLLLLFTCLLSFHLSPRLGACGWVPGRLVSHFLSHFFSFVSQFFSLSPRLGACGRGFAAGLSPTSFHLSPTSFHLSPTSFHLSPTSYHLSPRLGACGRVSGWLVSHFLSYVSHFFSFVSLGACGRVCGWLVSHVLSFVSHFFHLSPSSFHLSPTSFHSPNSLLLGVLNALKNGRLGAGWSGRVPSRLVSHFLCLPVLFSRGSRLACLPLPFICLPILFICLPGHFLSFVSHFFSLSPRLGACGRVPGRLVSHFLSFVSHFFSFVSQAGCLWSGFRPACLPLPLSFVSHFLSFVSHFFSACGRVPGRLVSHFLLICLPLLFICHPLLFICLPGWVLVVGFPARLSPTCFHLSPGSFHLSPRNASFVSQVRHCWCHVAFLFICLCHC